MYHYHTLGGVKCTTVVHSVGLRLCIGFAYAYLVRHCEYETKVSALISTGQNEKFGHF